MSESGVRTDGGEREVWLRANPRPVVGLSLVVAAILAAIAAALLVSAAGWPAVIVAAALAIVAVAALGMLAAAARRPRLVRAGDVLEVRLRPTGVERVPLEVVECLFRGSEPLPVAGDEALPRYRVGTLVVRLAERAEAWQSRPTFRPWGGWDEGHITIDGRWCEPLSRETVGRIAERLLAAKRRPTE